MGNPFAPGTADADQYTARRDAGNNSQRENVYALLNGLGVIAQTVGRVHAYNQRQADQSVQAQYMSRAMDPASSAPPATMDEGPNTVDPMQRPQMGYDALQGEIRDRMRGWQQPSTLGAIGEAANPFSSPQGRLTPESAMGLLSFMGQRQAAQRDAAFKQAQLGLEGQRVGFEQLRAQAEQERAHGVADANILRQQLGAQRQQALQDFRGQQLLAQSGNVTARQAMQQNLRDDENLKAAIGFGQHLQDKASSYDHESAQLARALVPSQQDAALTALANAPGTTQETRDFLDSLSNAKDKAAAINGYRAQLTTMAKTYRDQATQYTGATNAFLSGPVNNAIQRRGGTPPTPTSAPTGGNPFQGVDLRSGQRVVGENDVIQKMNDFNKSDDATKAKAAGIYHSSLSPAERLQALEALSAGGN